MSVEVYFIIVVIMLIGTAILVSIACYYDGYKNGQVDAANGKQTFYLVEFRNKIRVWMNDKELKKINEEYKIIKKNET